jgi:predicted extracellular nuclease
MTEFTIASFNVKNLIGAKQEYYKFEQYTPEEYAWKQNWLSQQLLTMDADIVCFQEIFDESSLNAVINDVNAAGEDLNAEVIPGREQRYRRKAIFKKLKFDSYREDQVFFAKNITDGEPGKRRPGLAMLSRFGFVGTPEVIQQLDKPVTIEFPSAGYDSDEIAGSYTIERISRPMIKAKIEIGNQVVTVFNCHLKSKLGEYIKPAGSNSAPESDLTHYLPAERALGELRAMLRRSAEAYVLRQMVVEELKLGNPVFVLGDFNDSEYSIASAIIKGEKPFKNYSWMRRHDAKSKGERYSGAEDKSIRAQVLQYQLQSAEMQFIKRSQRDMVYTTAFGGVYESIDQILMSQHFVETNKNAIGGMEYFSVFNDHITNGEHPDAPYNKLASDHGQIMAHMRLY